MNARTLLRISGPDARPFLQGLITNDVEKLDQAGIIYAALLTPQGKYLADFFLVKDGDTILLDVASDLAEGLTKRLNMYRLRANVVIETTDLQLSRGTGPAPEGAVADPRHPALGWRAYGAEAADDDSNWTEICVTHTIPETGVELTPDSFILEAGFERLNGVDFSKGCYVGQEVTARMKHKTTLRKGLVTVDIEGDAASGSQIMRDDKPVGTLFSTSGSKAIAYLRFDRAGDGMTAQGVKVQWTKDEA